MLLLKLFILFFTPFRTTRTLLPSSTTKCSGMRSDGSYPITILQANTTKLDLKKLNGPWYQCATNDPTIPCFCNKNSILFSLSENENKYTIKFNSECVGKNFTVPLYGDIVNNTFYENFQGFPKIHENNIVNVVENNEIYEIVEWFSMYKKNFRVYQLWSRKKLEKTTIMNYVKRAKEKYGLYHVVIDNFEY